MAEATAFRNNALPYPVYAAPFAVTFSIIDADGDQVTGATGLDSEVSKNGDTFADCTNEATEIATASGVYYLLLTGAEMTADIVTVQVKTTSSGAKTTLITLYPRKLVSLRTGTAQGGAAGYITLDASAGSRDDRWNGCLCVAVIDTLTECRIINDYTGSNQQAAVTPSWNVVPDSDDTFTIYLPEGMQLPTVNVGHINETAQTAIDIATNLDAAVSSRMATYTQPTGFLAATFPATVASTTNITAGTITTVTTLTNDPTGVTTLLSRIGGAITISGGAVDANVTKVAGTTQAAGDIVTLLGTPAAGSISTDIATLTNNVANIGVDVDAIIIVTDKLDTAMVLDGAVYQFTANALELAPTGGSAPSAADIADAVWDEVQSGHTTAGTFGLYLDSEVSGAGGGLDAAGVRAAVGLATANLDTQLADLPTVAEFEARTIPAADYFDPAIDVVGNVLLVDEVTTLNGHTANSGDPYLILMDSIYGNEAIKNIVSKIIVRSNTAQAGTATTITLDASASATTNLYKGQLIATTGGTGAGQARTVTAYNGTTKIATVDRAWATNPNATTTFTLFATDSPTLNTNLQVSGAASTVAIRTGTAQAGTTNTMTLDTGASATNSLYVGNTLSITSGTGLGQTRSVVAYNGTTKVATVDRNWTTTPGATSVFAIYASTTPTTFSDQGVAQSGSTSTIQLASTASATDDIYNGSIVTILSGTLAGETSEITDYVGATRTATVSPVFSGSPDTTSAYAVIPTQSGTGEIIGAGLTAAEVRIEMDANSTQLAKIGTPAGASVSADIAAVKAETAAILADTDALNVDIYTAVIEAVLDASVTDDEYSTRWRKNGILVTTGITTPLIQVIKFDGTDLIASTAMTQIGSTGAYKYSEGTNRIEIGQNYEVKITSTIDGSARTFSRFIARDSV